MPHAARDASPPKFVFRDEDDMSKIMTMNKQNRSVAVVTPNSNKNARDDEGIIKFQPIADEELSYLLLDGLYPPSSCKNQGMEEDYVAGTLARIAHLCVCDENHRSNPRELVQYTADRIATMGGVLALLNCLKRHSTSRKIQIAATVTLYNVLSNSQAARTSCKVSGGMQLLLETWQLNPSVEMIAQRTLRTMNWLLEDDRKLVEIFLDLGGIETVLESLERFSENEKIQLRACKCFVCLAHWSSVRPTLILLGVPIALSKMLQTAYMHRNEDVCDMARNALLAILE